jgi:UrcA family protein
MLASFSRATLSVLAGVTASTLVAALPASAQEYPLVIRGVPPGTNIRLVSYRDLDLNYIAHRKILNNRVGRAVRQVCKFSARGPFDADYTACASASWSGARWQITRAYVESAQFAYYRNRR